MRAHSYGCESFKSHLNLSLMPVASEHSARSTSASASASYLRKGPTNDILVVVKALFQVPWFSTDPVDHPSEEPSASIAAMQDATDHLPLSGVPEKTSSMIRKICPQIAHRPGIVGILRRV